MIHIKDIDTNPTPEGFGIRYEIGEGDSSHAYCHAQITLNPFERDSKPLFGLPDFIPQQTPCFPLLAKCPVSLLLALLVSLYGKIKGRDILSNITIAKEYTELIQYII